MSSEPQVIHFTNGETITVHDMPPMPALRMQRVLKDALYLMAEDHCDNATAAVCWKCPVYDDCRMGEFPAVDSALLLARHWFERAELLPDGEVPEW